MFGRRKTAIGFNCLLILGGFVTSMMANQNNYTAFDYVLLTVALGIFGTHVPTYVRVVEVLPTKIRLIVSTLLFGSGWAIARSWVTLVILYVKYWTLTMFILSLFACSVLMIRYACLGK